MAENRFSFFGFGTE